MKKRIFAILPVICLFLILLATAASAAEGDVAVSSANFPDETFRSYVSANFDADHNGRLSAAERNAVGSVILENKGITSFKGIENFGNLVTLQCSGNPVTSLDLSLNSRLQTVSCNGCDLETIDLPKDSNNNLMTLLCNSNRLAAIRNLDKCTLLQTFFCQNNELYGLNLSKCTQLEVLRCDNNHLRFLNLSNNPDLTEFSANQAFPVTYLYDPEIETHVYEIDGFYLDIYADYSDRFSEFSGGTIGSNGVISCTGAQFSYVFDTRTASTQVPHKMKVTLYKQVPIDQTNFPDASFRSCIAGLFDTDRDGTLTGSELTAETLNVSRRSIRDLTGIEHFCSLQTLDCSGNDLTGLILGGNTDLVHLYCDNNLLTGLDVRIATGLRILSCENNELTGLDLSQNTALRELHCAFNNLQSLDLTKNTGLEELYCSSNELTSLDLSRNTSLRNASCDFSGQHRTVPAVNGLDLYDYLPDRGALSYVTLLDGAYIWTGGNVSCSGSTLRYNYDTGNDSLDSMLVTMHAAKYAYGSWYMEQGTQNKVEVTVNSSGTYIMFFARYTAGRMTGIRMQQVSLSKGEGRNSVTAPFALQAGDRVFLTDTDLIPVTEPLTVT